MPYSLTKTQRDLLLIIQEQPSLFIRELAEEMDLRSTARIHEILRALRERGYIEWLPRRHRGIVVTHPIPFPEEPEIALNQ